MKGSKGGLYGRIPDLTRVWREHLEGGASPGRGPAGLDPGEMRSVAGRVRELSRGLTRDRGLAGERYFSEPSLLGAYLLYYWPVSYAQCRILLGMLPGSFSSALDLGSGPGPFSLALLDHGVRRVTALDRSRESLALARRIAELSGRSLLVREWDAAGNEPLPPGPFDIVTSGHLLNELWAGDPDRVERRFRLVERAAAVLSPEGTVLIAEPALQSTAADLLRLRDRLVSAGWLIRSPCFFGGPCPALPDGVCHAEWDWTPPPLVRDIARMSRVSPRENLKSAYIAASPPGASPAAAFREASDAYRVVSDRMLSKSGRVRFFVCGPGGRFTLSAKRNDLPPELGTFFTLRRGDVVRFSGTEERENGRGLAAGSRLEILRRRPGGN